MTFFGSKDMIKIKQHNDGHAYILTCTDILSRYGLASKTKQDAEVAAAIKYIFETSQRKPKRFQTDQGK